MDDSHDRFEAYLHEQIPLTAAMGLRIVHLDRDSVALEAPLAPNRNHKGGAFGGSIGTLALTAAWIMVHRRVRGRSPEPTVVVMEQSVEYLHSIDEDFQAKCFAPPEKAWNRFERSLERRGKGRIELEATVEAHGDIAARFRGIFAAVGG